LPVPDEVIGSLRARCPWALRRSTDTATVTDVSASSLWLRAAPAWAWSRNTAELSVYLWRRLRPEREEQVLTDAFFQSQPWVSEGQWYSVARWRRLLRLLTGRPARPQVLRAVRMVL
jgi:hypothetical protein